MSKIFKSNKGFTLIETAIAVMIIMVGIVGIYGIIPRLLKTAYMSSDRFIASQIAKEGAEIIRNFRDSAALKGDPNAWGDLLVFLSPCSGTVGVGGSFSVGGCEIDYNDTMVSPPASYASKFLGTTSLAFFVYDSGALPTKFKRRIIVNPQKPQGVDMASAPNNDMLNITIEVVWGDNATDMIRIFEQLYNWR